MEDIKQEGAMGLDAEELLINTEKLKEELQVWKGRCINYLSEYRH